MLPYAFHTDIQFVDEHDRAFVWGQHGVCARRQFWISTRTESFDDYFFGASKCATVTVCLERQGEDILKKIHRARDAMTSQVYG